MMFSQRDLLTDNLFERVLLDPARANPNGHLLIVSGYATAGMAERHMSELRKENLSVSISLIVGMVGPSGIAEAQHLAFKDLIIRKPHGFEFECRYVQIDIRVHSKTYLWLDQNKSHYQAFCGSANYTINGFSERQIESMASSDPLATELFYKRIRKRSIACHDVDIPGSPPAVPPFVRPALQEQHRETVSLSLLTQRTGETGKKSGVNWGQRLKRDKNQAYISY